MAEANGAEALPFRFFVLSCRNPGTDFRKPLVDALRRHHETWYISLKRRPVVSGPFAGSAPTEMSFPAFVAWLRRAARRDAENVYFNSTNLAFPLIIPALRLVARPGIWCMDMHDDLLYDTTGLRRLASAVAVRIQTAIAHLTVHCAESLTELFPRSRHLGNASHVQFMARPTLDLQHILILASLDQRFDFDLTAAVARRFADVTFHIHGQVSLDRPDIRARLQTLLSDAANITYHGPYDLSGLDAILHCYSVSLAPYRTDHRLTRYIDPLRFYHCLNSGMEIITTPIPQAQAMQSCLHIIHTAAEFAAALANLPSHLRNTREHYRLCSWNERAEKLTALLCELRNRRRPSQAANRLQNN